MILWWVLVAAEEWSGWLFLPKYLLWTLYFLKVYNVEDVGSAVVHVCRNTYRQWIWCVLGVFSLTLHTVGKFMTAMETNGY
jgi:hypothetical protein